ncbi:unnamed protein product [Tenebrio molitor]|nr:unnamed protein product [Tenebrio molitor]
MSHLRYECGKAPSFVCQYCYKSFHQKSNLKAHLRRCKLCGTIYTFWNFLGPCLSEPALYTCKRCNKSYMYKMTFKRHIKYQ